LDIALFLIFALGVPWATWLTLGVRSKTTALAMMAPGGVAAILMLTISPLRLGHSPLARFGPPEYAVIAWGVPVIWVAALAGLNLLFHKATPSRTFPDPKIRSEIVAKLIFAGALGALLALIWLWPRLPWGKDLPLGLSSWQSLSVTVSLLTLFSLLTRLVTQALVGERALGRTLAGYPRYLVTVLVLGVLLPLLGEELGWRGFLFPRLVQYNVHLALLGTMAAWWLFHGPLGYLTPTLRGLPRWIPALGLLGIAGPSFFAGWLLLQTGSLWPPLIFHLTWNLLNPAMLGSLYTGKEGLLRGPIWLINGEGVMGTIVSTTAIAPLFYWLALQAAQN